MASRKSERIKLTSQATMGKKMAGKKRKGLTEKDALEVTDSEGEEETPLAVILSSMKSKKTGESSKTDKEGTTGTPEKEKTPTPKRKKQKANRSPLKEIEEVEEDQEAEKVAEPEKNPEPEAGESSKKKKKKEKTGKEFISHSWFNDFQTYGKWLDGYASNPVGYCSLISPLLIEKLKKAECFVKLMNSSAWSIINRSEIAYPRLTKLFYINLKQKEGLEWGLTSKVAGVDIELNYKVFSEVLGFEFDSTENQGLDRRQVVKDAKKEFFIEENPSKHQLTHSILKAEAKILFTIFMRCIVPKEHSRELLSDKVLYMMYLVMHDLHLGLPGIVMEHMFYAASMKKKYALPYSNLLSLFFKHFGIPLDKEETVKEGFGMISEKSLQNLGIIQTKKGTWKLSKALTPEKAEQSQVLQKLTVIENEVESLKEGMFEIGSELLMMRSHLTSIDKTLGSILDQVQLSKGQEEALHKEVEEESREGTKDSDDSETPSAEIKKKDKGKGKQLSSDELFETGSGSESGEKEADEEDSEETGTGSKAKQKDGEDSGSD